MRLKDKNVNIRLFKMQNANILLHPMAFLKVSLSMISVYGNYSVVKVRAGSWLVKYVTVKVW